MYQMLLIRRFEEKILEMFAFNKLAGSMFHVCIGEEAVAAGVCANLRPTDQITSTHRGHGHFIAKGGDLNLMMAELFGKETGYCKGKGGSMHIADISLGHLGANGIVGGGFAIAAGAALANTIQENDKVTVCFFGDGAANEGLFHEALNAAGVWKLPIVYVCENNMYALSTPFEKASAVVDIYKRAESYGFEGIKADGMDVISVSEAAHYAIEKARNGGGPTLLECKTYRFFGHSRSDASVYRSKEEENEYKARCPVLTFSSKLLEENILTQEELDEWEREIEIRLLEAIDFADSSPYPPVSSIYEDIYA